MKSICKARTAKCYIRLEYTEREMPPWGRCYLHWCAWT